LIRWESVRLAGQNTAGNASINGVTPGYLPLFISRIVGGRNIARADIDSGAKVAVVGEDLLANSEDKGCWDGFSNFPMVLLARNRSSSRLWVSRP
jgi:hypothetical protein